MSEDEFDAVIATHLKGHFTVFRHAAAIMRKQESGSLVGFTSGAYAGSVAQANYSAAKGGIVSLVRSAAVGLHRYGVRANAVAPVARTRMSANVPSELAEMGDPEDVAPLVVFLLSDAAKDVTGQVYTAVGGRIAVWNQPVEVRSMTRRGSLDARADRRAVRRGGPGADGAHRPARADPPSRRVGPEAQRLSEARHAVQLRRVHDRALRSTRRWRGRRRRRGTTRSSCPTASPTRVSRTRRIRSIPTGRREFLEDKPFIEPFSLIPALGAVTTTLRFVTFVVKLPIRHPVMVAKQVASVAVLTGNRFLFGVGTSPWPEDYELLDVPWERRGKRMNEAIDVIRGLTGGRVLRVPRRGVRRAGGQDVPRPDPARAHPDRRARRGRAAPRRGHGRRVDARRRRPGRPAGAAGTIGRAAGRGGARGRAVRDTRHLDGRLQVDGVRRLEEQGVTDVIVGFRWPYVVGPDTEPLQTKIDSLRRFADAVITKAKA